MFLDPEFNKAIFPPPIHYIFILSNKKRKNHFGDGGIINPKAEIFFKWQLQESSLGIFH